METPPNFPEDEDKEEDNIDEEHKEIMKAWQKKLERF